MQYERLTDLSSVTTYGEQLRITQYQPLLEDPTTSIIILFGVGLIGVIGWRGIHGIRDRINAKRLTKKFEGYLEHSSEVPSGDQLAEDIADLTVAQYARDKRLRESLRGTIDRMVSTRNAKENPPEEGDGSTRPS